MGPGHILKTILSHIFDELNPACRNNHMHAATGPHYLNKCDIMVLHFFHIKAEHLLLTLRMAVDYALGFVAYAITILVGFVSSYYYLSIFGEKAGAPNIDLNLERQITSQVQIIVQQSLNTIISPFLAIWLACIQVGQIATQNWKYVLFMAIAFALCILMHYEHQDLMSGLDQFWRCFAHTAFYNFFVPFLQVLRLTYGFFTPLFNLLAVTYYQIVKGSLQIFLKCQVQTIFIPIEHIVVGVVKLALSFVDFLGFTKLPISTTNNIAVNDWNIEPGIQEITFGLNSTQTGLRCACNALDPVWDLGFAPVTSDHLPKAVDHWFNAGVRVAQMFLRIIIPPGEAPNIERIMYHAYGGILESAFFVDHVLYTTITNVVRIFALGLFDAEGIKQPAEFVAGSAARTGLTLLQLPVNMLKGVWAMFNPEITGDSAAMMNAFNFDDVWANLYISLYDISNSVHWFLYLIENIVGGLATASTIKASALPETFECDWVEDYSPDNIGNWPHAPHMISYTAACTIYNSGLVLLGGPLVFSEMIKELFFKSIVLQEQNMLRVIQKYDGMWTSREEISTCEKRRERASPLNGTMRLDWTIDPDRCNCDMQLGAYVAPDPNNLNTPDYRYISKPVYNPWCGQPTFQDQIFAPMDSALIYLTHGIFGPTGIGEIFQYYSVPTVSSVLEGEAEESAPVETQGISIPPINRMQIELMRVTVRMLLSFPDIFTGNWIYYDINCGYGLNTTHLDFRYRMLNGIEYNEETGEYTKNGAPVMIPTDDETLRWGPCKKREFKFPGFTYKREDDMKTCVSSNEADDCSCNFMLPLTIDSPCACIATLPELSTIADDNPIANYFAYKQITKASFRWCNSNYLEWFFYMQNQLLDSLAYMVSFGPWNTDCVPARAIKADTSFGAYYVMAQTTTTDSAGGDDIELAEKMCKAGGADVFDDLLEMNPGLKEILGDKCENIDRIATSRGTCKLWSNDNLFCSLSMVLRSLGGGLIAIQRQIHNNVIMFMAGNWNDFNFDLRHRLCDIEKAYAAMVGAFTNVVTFGGARGIKKGLGKLFIMMFEVGLLAVKMGNLLVQFLFTYVNELKKAASGQGGDVGSGMSEHVKNLMKEAIRLIMDIFILFLDACGDVFEAISSGSGGFFYSISDMLTFLAKALAGTLFDILATIFDLLFEMLALFSGTGSVGNFLNALWGFLMKILNIMIRNMGRVLRAIFMMLGPSIGGFLNSLMTGVCSAINTVICTLSLGWTCSVMSCLSSGFGNAEGQPLGAQWQGHRGKYLGHELPRLFAQHYETVDGMPAPHWVATNINWTGSSTCDLFMEGVKYYNYTEMRPLERATWLNCLEERAIGAEIAKIINIPEFELDDVIYNWHRKWIVSLDMLSLAGAAANIALNHGSVTDARLRAQLVEMEVLPDGPIKAYNKIGEIVLWLYDQFKLDTVIDDMFASFDPEYMSEGRPTMTAKVYQTGKEIHNVASELSNQWVKRDVSRKGWRVFDTMTGAAKGEGWLKETFTSNKLQATGHLVRQFIATSGHHIRRSKKPGRTFKRERTRLGNPYHVGLKKPLNTNISFPDTKSILCPDPESPACVQCTIIDNVFELIRDWANAMGRFQSNVYAVEFQAPDPNTGFIQPGTLTDINAYFVHMMTNNSGFIDTTQQLTRAKRKLHRKFHPYSKKRLVRRRHKLRTPAATYDASIAPITARWSRVGRDWEELWGNISEGNISSPEFKAVNKKLVVGIKGLLSETGNDFVPFFGYGIPYTVSFIFTESCPVETAVWNEGTSQSERLSNIDSALWACFWFTLALMTNGIWSVIPLGAVVNTIVLVQLNKLLFFWIVYGYLPSCEPTMPHMLLEDITEWVQHRIAPGCFCESWPLLTAAWCAPSTCYQCGIAAGQYLNCNDEIPFAQEWGVWWWFPALLRWTAPGAISWLAETGVVQEGDAAFQDLIFDSFQNANGTSSLFKECVYVTSGDLFVNATVALFVGYVLFQITLVLFKLLIDLFLLLWQTYLLFQWTAIAIEQSTRVSADETDDSDEIFSG